LYSYSWTLSNGITFVSYNLVIVILLPGQSCTLTLSTPKLWDGGSRRYSYFGSVVYVGANWKYLRIFATLVNIVFERYIFLLCTKKVDNIGDKAANYTMEQNHSNLNIYTTKSERIRGDNAVNMWRNWKILFLKLSKEYIVHNTRDMAANYISEPN
jgi:hypothetical protein